MSKFITKLFLFLFLFLSTSAFSMCAFADSPKEQIHYLEQSRATALSFMHALGGTLKSLLDNAETENAIIVCKQIAPALAADYSKDGWIVKRVSLKPRNKSMGVPDTWERRELESFDRHHQSGEPTDDLEMSAIVDEADGLWFRYLKAIPTQSMCLQCHGKPEDIPDGVKAILAREYPDDEAIGYRVDEIRGAISIKRQISAHE